MKHILSVFLIVTCVGCQSHNANQEKWNLEDLVLIGWTSSSFVSQNTEFLEECYPRLAGLRREFDAHGIQALEMAEWGGVRFDDVTVEIAIQTKDLDRVAELCADYGPVEGLYLYERPWLTYWETIVRRHERSLASQR